MGVAQKVVDELNKGISQEELARKFPWISLARDDTNILLTIALRLGDNERSYTLLVYLFAVSFGKDLWFSTEVLSQTLQHPRMTPLDRQAILPTMRNQLDQIKDQINAKVTPSEKLNKYWLMEASYYSVKGNHLAENGNRGEAVQNYQVAQSIFEQLGLAKQVTEYKALIRRLSSLDAFRSPLPKTSPIRLRSALTEPLTPESLSQPKLQSLEISPQTAGMEPAAAPAPSAGEVQKAGPAAGHIDPFLNELAAGPVENPPAFSSAFTISLEPSPAASEKPAAVPLAAPPAAAQNTPPPPPEAAGVQAEGLAISGIYYPLPDVWLENGQLHILGINEFKGDEAQEQAEQIRQQCEILIGLQLQVKMYHIRRSMLAEEMKILENKAQALKAKIERQEKKLQVTAG